MSSIRSITLLFSLLICVPVTETQDVYLRPNVRGLIVWEGSHETVECYVTSHEKTVDLTWTKDIETLRNLTVITTITDNTDSTFTVNKILTFESFRVSDSGRYTCTLRYNPSSASQRQIELQFHEKCSTGTFGIGCRFKCSPHCKQIDTTLAASPCHYKDGTCVNGCNSGYTEANCTAVCPYGKYGVECSFVCNEFCKGSSTGSSPCHHVSGYCLFGCHSGYRGAFCTNVIPSESGLDLSVIIGVSGALVVLVVLILIIYCCHQRLLQKCHQFCHNQQSRDHAAHDDTVVKQLMPKEAVPAAAGMDDNTAVSVPVFLELKETPPKSSTTIDASSPIGASTSQDVSNLTDADKEFQKLLEAREKFASVAEECLRRLLQLEDKRKSFVLFIVPASHSESVAPTETPATLPTTEAVSPNTLDVSPTGTASSSENGVSFSPHEVTESSDAPQNPVKKRPKISKVSPKRVAVARKQSEKRVADTEQMKEKISLLEQRIAEMEDKKRQKESAAETGRSEASLEKELRKMAGAIQRMMNEIEKRKLEDKQLQETYDFDSHKKRLSRRDLRFDENVQEAVISSSDPTEDTYTLGAPQGTTTGIRLKGYTTI